MELLRKIYKMIQRYWVQRSSEAYLNYLRKRGFKIGDNTYFQNPKSFRIDLTRPSLITIGSDCRFNVRNNVIAHDVVSRVFIKKYNDFLPSEGRITIGNNVIFGSDVTVVKGVTIGDNCIIGLGSVVTRDIPANSVAIGSPAKVICTLDEYYEKRKEKAIEESFEYARSIGERYGRRPVPADFWDSFVFFVSGKDMDQYP
jgi:acetyltransferase-like isoleucine patch superfamily enzyme